VKIIDINEKDFPPDKPEAEAPKPVDLSKPPPPMVLKPKKP